MDLHGGTSASERDRPSTHRHPARHGPRRPRWVGCAWPVGHSVPNAVRMDIEPTDDHLHTRGDDEFCHARRRAVEDSVGLLRRRWPAWCAEHQLAAPEAPLTQPPVIYQVGMDPEQLQWVALIRFDAEAGGQRWRGIVRGPVDDVVFQVGPTEAVVDAPSRRDGTAQPPSADRSVSSSRLKWRRRHHQ